MTAKTDLPPVPAALADVALIDGPTCAAAAGISISSWLDAVRTGAAPQPVIRQPRHTRWRLVDIRAWLVERAAQPHDQVVIQRAKHASTGAQAARQRRAAGLAQAGA